MTHWVRIFVLLFPGLIWGQESSGLGSRPRPPRKIEKLPSCIRYVSSGESIHTYTLTGICKQQETDLKEAGSLYQSFVPDCVKLQLDYKADTCVFTTSRRLGLEELSYAMDDLADLGGHLPFWLELEARDWPVSDLYSPERFNIKPVTEKQMPASGFAWFAIPKGLAFDSPLGLGGPEMGKLRIVPFTTYCMCHQRFTLRIVDAQNKVIWNHDKELFGSLKLAITDLDGDSVHEILLWRYDHGKLDHFMITPRDK